MFQNSTTAKGVADVVLIHDDSRGAGKIAGLLRQHFKVTTHKLEKYATERMPAGRVSIFCLSKIEAASLPMIRRAASQFDAAPTFVFPTFNAQTLDYAKTLSGQIFVDPINEQILIASVKAACNEIVEAGWSALAAKEAVALKSSLAGFECMMRATARGEGLPLHEISNACENIQKGLIDSSIDRWLGALKDHHDSTFRHSMFVCGSLSYFAHAIGIGGIDLKELTLGGFLHDAGKARIPHTVLDKPTKLDPEEWEIMKTHPMHSHDILGREAGMNKEIVAMATHHHERLDGTGYPDGLSNAQICDHIRLTAIADVFSALIEPRAYKEPMSNERALEIMSSFKGHLDLTLVGRFREFVLDHEKASAA